MCYPTTAVQKTDKIGICTAIIQWRQIQYCDAIISVQSQSVIPHYNFNLKIAGTKLCVLSKASCVVGCVKCVGSYRTLVTLSLGLSSEKCLNLGSLLRAVGVMAFAFTMCTAIAVPFSHRDDDLRVIHILRDVWSSSRAGHNATTARNISDVDLLTYPQLPGCDRKEGAGVCCKVW